MEPALRSILESFPQKRPRSKLEPHLELIRQLRRRGYTYREVSRLFREQLGLSVAPSTLHSFVKVRAKHRKRTEFELPPSEPALVDSHAPDPIDVLRAKPADPTTRPARFVFRESEPLSLTGGGAR